VEVLFFNQNKPLQPDMIYGLDTLADVMDSMKIITNANKQQQPRHKKMKSSDRETSLHHVDQQETSERTEDDFYCFGDEENHANLNKLKHKK
jgi:hypothetical protein